MHLLLTPPSFAGSTSSHSVAQGDREWGLWSAHHMLPLPLLIPWSLPVFQCGILKHSPSWPSPESFHWAAILHKRAPLPVPQGGGVLQEWTASLWSLMGSQIHPENLFQYGLFCTDGSSCQEPAPVWEQSCSFVQGTAICSSTGPALGCLQVHIWSTVILGAPGEQPASPWSASWAAGEPWLWYLEHLLPLLPQCPWCLQTCFSHVSSLLSPRCCCAAFFTLS